MSMDGARHCHPVLSESLSHGILGWSVPFTITSLLAQTGVSLIIRGMKCVNSDPYQGHVLRPNVIDGIMDTNCGESHDRLCKTVSAECPETSVTSFSCQNSVVKSCINSCRLAHRVITWRTRCKLLVL